MPAPSRATVKLWYEELTMLGHVIEFWSMLLPEYDIVPRRRTG
jgi:hypothetical protein